MWGLRARRLFDGDDFVADAIIVVGDDGLVVSVGEPAPDDVAVRELGYATLMPGLVDCHQHLVFNMTGTLEEQVHGCSDDELADRAMANARTALQGGVTTLRDLGDRNYVTLCGLIPICRHSSVPVRPSRRGVVIAGTSVARWREPKDSGPP